jgi:hypothetical protein
LHVIDGAISCDCMAGRHGRLCKHSLAVSHLIEKETPSCP